MPGCGASGPVLRRRRVPRVGPAAGPAHRAGRARARLDLVLRAEGHRLSVAGRTDTGVHARGQVAHLEVSAAGLEAARGRSERPAVEVLVRRLNGVLDADVRVHRAQPAPPGFDARFSAVWRRYAYRIADGPEAVDPLARGHVLAWGRRLDLEAYERRVRRTPRRARLRSVLQEARGRHHDPYAARPGLGARPRRRARGHRACGRLLPPHGPGPRGLSRRRGGGAPRARAGRERCCLAGVRDPAVPVLHAHGLTLEEVGYPADTDLAGQAARSRVVRTLPGAAESAP